MRPCKGCEYEIFEKQTADEPEYLDCKLSNGVFDSCEIRDLIEAEDYYNQEEGIFNEDL